MTVRFDSSGTKWDSGKIRWSDSNVILVPVSGSIASSQAETTDATGASIRPSVAGQMYTGQGERSNGVVSASAGAGLPTGTYVVSGGLPDSQDAAGLTLRATYLGATIDRTLWITKAKKGQDGAPGGAGDPGAPALNLLLSKAAMLVFTYAEGTPVDPTFAAENGQLTVLLGTTDVTGSCTLSVTGTGCTGTINTAADTPLAGHPVGFYQLTAATADTAQLQVNVTYSGYVYHAVVSIAKAKGGYQIVSSLPTTNLFDGRIVYLTSDGKLYRYVGTPPTGSWTAAVKAVDIQGLITSDQIAAIQAAKIAGQLTSDQIASIDAAKVTGNLPAALDNGRGGSINADPTLSNPSAWNVAGASSTYAPFQFVTVNDGKVGTTAVQSSGVAKIHEMESQVLPIAYGKSYRLQCWARILSSPPVTMYLRLLQYDTAGNLLAYAIVNADLGISFEGWSQSTSTWTLLRGNVAAAAGAVKAQVSLITNYPAGSSPSVVQVQDLRLVEMVDSDLIVNGAVTAASLAAGSVVAGKIAAGAVVAGALAANAVTAGTVSAGVISAREVAVSSLTGDRIAVNTISGVSMIANSMNANVITAGSMTADRFSAGVIITAGAQITDGVILSAKIGALQVKTANIDDLTVGTSKIADFAVNRFAYATLASLYSGGTGAAPAVSCGYTPDDSSHDILVSWVSFTRPTASPINSIPSYPRLSRIISGVETVMDSDSILVGGTTLGNSNFTRTGGTVIDNTHAAGYRTYNLYGTNNCYTGPGSLVLVQEIKK